MCEKSREDPLARLAAAVDGLANYFAHAPTAALGPDLSECRRQQDRLEAAFTLGTGRFAPNREFAAEGAPTALSWLKANCRMSAGAAVEHLAIARELGQLPETSAAFASGDLGYQHAALIAKTAGRVGADAVRMSEKTLLQAATEMDPNRFSLLTRQVRNMVDPDGALADANRAYEQRYLHVSSSLDGLVFVDGRLDPAGGAVLQTALNALTAPMPGDPRKAEQRRADALVDLCRRQLDGGKLPEAGGRKPHLSVTVSAAALAGMPGTEGGTLEWGGIVPAETVRRLACDAALTVIPLDASGVPIDAGRATRTIPPNLRRALAVRDGGCRFPGCDRPIDWTDGHHLQHWADGGPTTLANLALLCGFHHHLVHEGGWRFLRAEDGGWQAMPPPGTTRRDRREPAAARAPAP